jgi:hypothetical protein
MHDREEVTFDLGAVSPSLIYIGLMLLGIVMLFFALYHIRDYLGSADWQPVNAKIVNSRIIPHEHRESEYDENDRYVGETVYYTYEAQMQYRYTVNGQQYIGDNITFGEELCIMEQCLGGRQQFDTEREARRLLRRFSLNSERTVYYNPANPEEAVVERSLSGMYWLLIGAAVVEFFIGAGLFIMTAD